MTTKCILVIDDEDDIREVAQLCLEMEADWHVLTASSGTEGIATAKAQQPDAILLDVMMPDMDGFTTFQQLQSDPASSSIPVILLTAKVQSADRSNFQAIGVAGWISKPFDPVSLANQVAEMLGWQL